MCINLPEQISNVTIFRGFCLILPPPPSIFRRVLPLPSEAWQEFSGNVFCHDHAHTSAIGGKVSTFSATLLPREGDCLISESSVLVRKSALTPKALLVKAANAVSGWIALQLFSIVCTRSLSRTFITNGAKCS